MHISIQSEVFVGSPSDCQTYQDQIKRIIEGFIHTKEKLRYQFIFRNWATAASDFQRAQAAINKTVRESDLHIFIFKEKWGTPSKGEEKFSSGTFEEVYEAYKSKLELNGSPRGIAIYFIKSKTIANNSTDLQRMVENAAISAFRKSLGTNVLYKMIDEEELETTVNSQLDLWASEEIFPKVKLKDAEHILGSCCSMPDDSMEEEEPLQRFNKSEPVHKVLIDPKRPVCECADPKVTDAEGLDPESTNPKRSEPAIDIIKGYIEEAQELRRRRDQSLRSNCLGLFGLAFESAQNLIQEKENENDLRLLLLGLEASTELHSPGFPSISADWKLEKLEYSRNFAKRIYFKVLLSKSILAKAGGEDFISRSASAFDRLGLFYSSRRDIRLAAVCFFAAYNFRKRRADDYPKSDGVLDRLHSLANISLLASEIVREFSVEGFDADGYPSSTSSRGLFEFKGRCDELLKLSVRQCDEILATPFSVEHLDAKAKLLRNVAVFLSESVISSVLENSAGTVSTAGHRKDETGSTAGHRKDETGIQTAAVLRALRYCMESLRINSYIGNQRGSSFVESEIFLIGCILLCRSDICDFVLSADEAKLAGWECKASVIDTLDNKLPTLKEQSMKTPNSSRLRELVLLGEFVLSGNDIDANPEFIGKLESHEGFSIYNTRMQRRIAEFGEIS